jgi:hypothetical protein
MSVATAYINQVADALLVNLQGIGNGTGPWRSAPKTVNRGIAVDAQSLPKPGLFLLSRGWGPNEGLPRGNFTSGGRVEAKFDVLCLVDFPVTAREAEAALNDLAADVIAAIERDPQLGTLMPSGYISAVGYQPEVELSGATFSVASVEVYATWLWDTDNP